jgi:hypothetical protein
MKTRKVSHKLRVFTEKSWITQHFKKCLGIHPHHTTRLTLSPSNPQNAAVQSGCYLLLVLLKHRGVSTNTGVRLLYHYSGFLLTEKCTEWSVRKREINFFCVIYIFRHQHQGLGPVICSFPRKSPTVNLSFQTFFFSHSSQIKDFFWSTVFLHPYYY